MVAGVGSPLMAVSSAFVKVRPDASRSDKVRLCIRGGGDTGVYSLRRQQTRLQRRLYRSLLRSIA